MLNFRLIPVLLLKNGGIVKGTKFKNHKYIGDPINTIRIFNDKKADELIFLDIEATNNKKSIDIDLIKSIAGECYMPFSVGGGISNLEQIRELLYNGAEKVCINTSIHSNPSLIVEASKYFGKQSIVGCVDIWNNFFGNPVVYINSGRKKTSVNLVDWCKKLEDLGCGEIMLCSINRDGTMIGYDVDLFRKVSDSLSIPLIASGGANSLEDINNLKYSGKVSAAAAGSFFVFHGSKKGILITYPTISERKLVGK